MLTDPRLHILELREALARGDYKKCPEAFRLLARDIEIEDAATYYAAHPEEINHVSR